MKVSNVIPWVLTVVVTMLLLNQCNKSNNLKHAAENQIEFLKDSVTQYKNKYGQVVAKKKALQGDKQSLQVLLTNKTDSLKQLSRIISNYKVVNFAANISTQTKIQNINTDFAKPVKKQFTRKFSLTDDYYNINGTVDQIGVTIDKLTVDTQISAVIGKKSTGWFSSEYLFEATSSNPYVNITQLDGGSFRSYDSPLQITSQIGYGITPQGLQPYFGVGLSLNLIKVFTSK